MKRYFPLVVLLASLFSLTALSDTFTSAGGKVFENPIGNGNLSLRVNVGGVRTDALTIAGSSASPTLGPVAAIGGSTYVGSKIVGKTDGVAVIAGYAGQQITWASAPGDQALTGSIADWTNANVVLTSGLYLVLASVEASISGNTSTNTFCFATVQITDSGNTIVQNQKQVVGSQWTGASSSINGEYSTSFSFVANVTTSTTYKIRAGALSCNGSSSVLNSANGQSYFFAVRLI